MCNILKLFLAEAKLVLSFVKDPRLSNFLNCYIMVFKIT